MVEKQIIPYFLGMSDDIYFLLVENPDKEIVLKMGQVSTDKSDLLKLKQDLKEFLSNKNFKVNSGNQYKYI